MGKGILINLCSISTKLLLSGYEPVLINEYVNVSPASGSKVDNVPAVVPIALFSGIDPDMFIPYGASLTLST